MAGQAKIRNADLAEPIDATKGGTGLVMTGLPPSRLWWDGTQFIPIPSAPINFNYVFKTTTGTPTVDGTVNFNNGTFGSIGIVYLTANDTSGNDITEFIEILQVGDHITVQDTSDPATIKRFQITTDPLLVAASPNYYSIAVTPVVDGGTAISLDATVAVKFDYGGAGGGGGGIIANLSGGSIGGAPLAGTTYYIGHRIAALQTTYYNPAMVIPYTGTVDVVDIKFTAGNAPSGEDFEFQLEEREYGTGTIRTQSLTTTARWNGIGTTGTGGNRGISTNINGFYKSGIGWTVTAGNWLALKMIMPSPMTTTPNTTYINLDIGIIA